MCGISGILGPKRPDDFQRVERMNVAQLHRGPDGEAIRSTNGATLGFVRLAIIDLDDRSMQPMSTPDDRIFLVFNGEIYNYVELKAELSAHYQFRTDSDSEVLLAAYMAWGIDCLERLNGMFAFCLWDTSTHTGFFARDRFGQKPLFLTEQDGRLFFASEVKALLAGGIEARADWNTWSRYLEAASYDDNPDSFFADITQLAPGECATWSASNGLRRRRYYSLAERIGGELEIDVETAANQVRNLLIDAARIHMRADVPISISLSGGLDSSALLSTIESCGRLSPDIACISVEFGEEFSERKWIEAAAGHHGLESQILRFTQDDFQQSIAPMLWHLEGPIGGLVTCGLAAIMQTASDRKYKVIHDGTGLDEAYAGYRNHHNLYLGLMLKRNDPNAEAAVSDYARNWNVDEDTARIAGLSALNGNISAIDGTVPVRPDLLSDDFRETYPAELEAPKFVADPLRTALADYLQVRKIPRNTRMKDRVSMAFGVELRLPFLDHRLVEHALQLPAQMYFLKGRSKSILREALTGLMDDSVRLAAKRSIQAPQGQWLSTGYMADYIGDLIESERFRNRGVFDIERTRRAFAQFRKGEFNNSFFVWQWINLEEWFRTFIDRSPEPMHHANWQTGWVTAEAKLGSVPA